MKKNKKIHIKLLNFALLFIFSIGVFNFQGIQTIRASGFDPSQVSGLKLWLEADQGLYKDTGKTQPATLNNDSVAVWADQSGQGNDASQATSGNRPTLNTAGQGGKPTLVFNGSSNSNLTLGNPASLNFTSGGYTMFTVYKRTTDTGAHEAFIGKGGNTTRGFFLLLGNTNYVWNFDQGPSTNDDSHNNLFTYYYEPISNDSNDSEGTNALFQNGGTPSLGRNYSALDGGSSWYIGDSDGSAYPFYGQIQAVIMYNRTLTDSEREQVHTYLAAKYNIQVTSYVAPVENSGAQIVYEGNSIVQGVNASVPNYRFPNQVHDILTTPYRYYNLGIGGQNTSGMTSRATNQDLIASSSYANNILVGWEGTNDLVGGALSGTSTYNGLASYYQARKTAGWKVISATILPVATSSGGGANVEANRQTANTLLKNNFSNFSDALVDIGNDPIIGSLSSSVPTYTDGLHPYNAGYTLIANQMAVAINALIHPLTTLSSLSTSIATSSAKISWTSDASSSSMVDFDVNNLFSTSTGEIDRGNRVFSHSITIPNLLACTTYHFRAHSKQLDPNGEVRLVRNDATSSDQIVNTTGCIGGASVISATSSIITTGSGGTFNLGNTSITVPTSYSGTTTSATFQAKQLDPTAFFAAASSTPSGKNKIGNYVVDLKALIDATTTLPSFTAPITVTLSYSPSDISGIDSSSLTIYRYDVGTGWTALTGCSVNTGANTVTCQTPHFSDFSLFGSAQASAPTTIVSSGGSAPLTAVGGSNGPYIPSTTSQTSICTNGALFNTQTGAACAGATISSSTAFATPPVTVFFNNLSKGTVSSDVKFLQQYLNSHGFIVSSSGAGSVGNETTFFGSATIAALARFQTSHSIIPAVGYFGPITRAYISSH